LSKRFKISLSNNELILGFFLFFLTVSIIAGSRWSRLYNHDAILSEDPLHIYLEDQTELNSLSETLADSGLIKSQEEFQWAAHIFGWKRFRKGHYKVDKGFSYDEFLSKLARGIQDPVSVTILPGRTKSKIAEAVSDDLEFDSLSFHQTITDSILLSNLDLEPEDVIGRLYPNTYAVYWTVSPEAFFKRILEEFNRAVITPYQQRIDSLDQTVDEIVTLASIIEWEARNSDEKTTISGLYWNRLNRGMRLQADPTINFAVGEQRRILYEDYEIDHPYNTYRYRGLPPGPITNPSLGSIKAALNPEDHEYLYMVATPEGSHSFSETFEEHKQKSAKWRKWLREQYRIKRQKERNSE
jgi:UPF0755 protein